MGDIIDIKDALLIPFDISVNATTGSLTSLSDVSVEIASESIHFILDEYKLELLLITYQTLIKSFQKSEDSVSVPIGVSSVSTRQPKTVSQPVDGARRRARTRSMLAEVGKQLSSRRIFDISSKETEDHAIGVFQLRLLLPSLALDVVYEPTKSKFVHSALSNFSLTLLNSTLTITSAAISVQDCCGPRKVLSLIEGSSRKHQGDFLSFTADISTLEMNIQLGELELTASAEVLLSLAPFLLTSHFLLLRQTSINDSRSPSIASSLDVECTEPLSPSKLPVIMFSLEVISLQLATIVDGSHYVPFVFSLADVALQTSANSVLIGFRSMDMANLSFFSSSSSNGDSIILLTTKESYEVSSSSDRALNVHIDYSAALSTEVSITLQAVDLHVQLGAYLLLAKLMTRLHCVASTLISEVAQAPESLNQSKAPLLAREATIKLSFVCHRPRLLCVHSTHQATLCFTSSIQMSYDSRISSLGANAGERTEESLLIRVLSIEMLLLEETKASLEQERKVLHLMSPNELTLSLHRVSEGLVDTMSEKIEGTVQFKEANCTLTLSELFLVVDVLSDVLSSPSSSTTSLALSPSAVSTPDTQVAIDGTSSSITKLYHFQLLPLTFNLTLLYDTSTTNSLLQSATAPFLNYSFTLQDALSVQGTSLLLSSSSTVHVKSSFFHPSLRLWEPLLEPTAVKLTLESDASTSVFKMSLGRVQINISSLLLRTFQEACEQYSLQQQQRLHRGPLLREEPVLQICNHLGVPVSLFSTPPDAITDASSFLLLTVASSSSGVVPRSSLSLPSAVSSVDLLLRGNDGDTVIKNFNLAPPTRCYPLPPKSATSSDESLKQAAVVLEEAIECIYENQRYALDSRAWVKPFLLNDPPPFSSQSSGTSHHHYQGTSLASHPLPPCRADDKSNVLNSALRWEWLGPWEVSLDGAIGTDMDALGYEYSVNFINFSDKRAVRRPLDVVRRRKVF